MKNKLKILKISTLFFKFSIIFLILFTGLFRLAKFYEMLSLFLLIFVIYEAVKQNSNNVVCKLYFWRWKIAVIKMSWMHFTVFELNWSCDALDRRRMENNLYFFSTECVVTLFYWNSIITYINHCFLFTNMSLYFLYHISFQFHSKITRFFHFIWTRIPDYRLWSTWALYKQLHRGPTFPWLKN